MNLSGDILKHLPKALLHLQHLKIEGPSLLSHKDFQKSFLEGKSFSDQLETLKLHNFDFLSDMECCRILEVCLRLKYLSLKGCKSLTIEGIFAYLLKLSNLTNLNIAFIGKSTGIASVVYNLPKLNSLTIDEPSYELNQYSLTKTKKNLLVTKLKQKV